VATPSLHLIAPAKINLSLRILGKREDGYHEIETLMAPIALADEIELNHVHAALPGSVTFTCNDPSLPAGDDNLCVQAAHAFQKALGIKEAVTISLLKKIPHGAGLGGGSSDAATVLRGMNMLFDEPFVFEELLQLATSLGSDVPFFLDPKPTWCRGRGELLSEAPPLSSWKLLLIKPPFPVATVEAYKRLQATGCRLQEKKPVIIDAVEIFNDLETPVFKKYLQLPLLKSWLQERPEVAAAWMTGSGSTMVAALKREISAESISALQENIATEFGKTFWIKETHFHSSSP
jgi:4-diphosphocytidyl-2-C-methyl-D-erythritol kinase